MQPAGQQEQHPSLLRLLVFDTFDWPPTITCVAPALRETASIKEPSCPWLHDVSTVLPEHTPQCIDTTARSTMRFGAEVRVNGRVNATISGRTNATSISSVSHMVSSKAVLTEKRHTAVHLAHRRVSSADGASFCQRYLPPSRRRTRGAGGGGPVSGVRRPPAGRYRLSRPCPG